MKKKLSYKPDIIYRRRLAVGLLGGSFDPAHAGHLYISSYAKKRLGLRQIWFLPARQNPLKSDSGSYEGRVSSVRDLLSGRGLSYRVCEAEQDFGLSYSWQTVQYLRRRYRRLSFVWLMGVDCWRVLPEWQRWRVLFRQLPFVIFARHPYRLREVRNYAGRVLSRGRVSLGGARILRHRGSGWVYFSPAPMDISSSGLRGRV